MAKSFAVWVEGEIDNTQKQNVSIDELHINFWCTRKPLINCIDFGIKFSYTENNNNKDLNLNVIIPFPITEDRIEDLSGKMEANKDLVSAIFNDHILATKNIKTKHVIYNLASQKNNPLALNTSLDFNKLNGRYDNRASVLVNHEFTKLSFKLSECALDKVSHGEIEHNENLQYYIRFRLKDLLTEEVNALIHKTENSDKYLTPFKDELIVIDFRVNELRVLPKDVRISLANAVSCPSKYHLFVIRDETDEYQLSHSGQSFKKCRILEGETWKKYFEDNIFKNEQSSMIYHWEKDCQPKIKDVKEHDNEKGKSSNMTDFIAVAKFRQTESPIFTILIYLLIVIVVSILSNGAYDWLKSFIPVAK